MNRLMTFGMDISWRRFLLRMAAIPEGGRILDVGVGTGDIAFEALKNNPELRVTGVDFTWEMMATGRERGGDLSIGWCRADAMELPFPDQTFDAVTSGFLVRNVIDVPAVIKEQVRVLKPGCRVVCLDTSPVPDNIMKPLVRFYLKKIIPLLGGLISGEKEAYKYLPESTLHFIEPEKLAEIMTDAGLEHVAFRRFMFGNISIHWGERPIPHTTTR